MGVQVLSQVRAQRGDVLRCKGWKQETLLRMLENNLENAQDPSRLIVYGGIAKAARNWESYHAIVDALKSLANDETLVVQAGMPVAVFRTGRLAPRVVMGLSNVIGATWPGFYELMDRNLTTFSSYTAGPWEYIGSQGIVEGRSRPSPASPRNDSAAICGAGSSSPPAWAAWDAPSRSP